jgi:hypothetical protein
LVAMVVFPHPPFSLSTATTFIFSKWPSKKVNE